MGLDTPSTVWDPAVGDEVATLESQHVLETTTSSSSSSPPPPTKSIEADTTLQQPNMEESPSSGSSPLGDVPPPVEGGEVTQDQGEAADPSKEEDTSKVAENLSSKEDITASPSTTSEGNGGAENATTVDSSASKADANAVTSSTSNKANINVNSKNSDETATLSREPSTTNANVENVEKVKSSTENVVEQQDDGATKVVENEHSEVTPQHQTDGGKTETTQPESTDSTASVTADQSAIEGAAQPPKAETAADNAKSSVEA